MKDSDYQPRPRQKILFLGYARTQTVLPGFLEDHGCIVTESKDALDEGVKGYDLVISFGFRHILSSEVINNSDAPIINLHIGLLPFNRGAHPNFWSFYEGTPPGVTIHLIDEGIDTGAILIQREIPINPKAFTFEQSHRLLLKELEKLFSENIDFILSKQWKPIGQKGPSTTHRVSDLPREFAGWDQNIDQEIRRLRSLKEKDGECAYEA